MPGHHCKKKELDVLLTHDFDEGDLGEAEEPNEAEPKLAMAELNQVEEVSLNLGVGLTTPKTMKLKRMISEH